MRALAPGILAVALGWLWTTPAPAQATAPLAPTSLTATAGNARVALSWTSGGDGGSPITEWEYARKEGNNAFGSWTDICVTSGNAGCPSTTTHTFTGLTNGTAYTFKVRAVNAVGNGAASAESSAVTPSLVCGRTLEVRNAIVTAVAGKSTCGAITSTDLAGISRIGIFSKTTLTALKAGDFAGLTGLTNLTMNSNSLGSLPAGVFDALTSLRELDLYGTGSFGSLPAGVFDKLTSLQKLDVGNLGLSGLSAGVFDKLTELTELKLYWNSLGSLPAGVFDKLTKLTTLNLTNNSALSCLPFIPSSVTDLKLSKDKSAFSACGAGVTVGSTGVSAGPGSTAIYTVVLDAHPTGNVTVTPASSAAGTATVSGALTFAQGNWSTSQTVTVTGVAVGSATVSHTVAGGGYGSATAADVAVTVANQAPSAPTSLTATSGDASVALSWTSGGNGGSPITEWEYARKEGNNAFGSWTDICVTSGNAGCPSTTSHTLTGLTNGTAYTFKVRAVNAIGNGAAAESSAVSPSSVCGRTPEVRDAIVAAVAGKSTCGAIADTDLAGISTLGIFGKTSLTALKAGDFAGLTGLTNLTMNDNSLGSLPAGVFDALTSLQQLDLYNTDGDGGSFSGLPAGVFDKLTSLQKLDVGSLGLSSLSAGVFDKLTELTELKLYWNSLGSLPVGVFDKLTKLKTLSLTNNPALSCLPFIPSSVTTLQLSKDKSAFSACGAGVTVGSTGVSVGPGSNATYTVVLDAWPTGDVTVTPESSATSTATVSGALTFAQGNWSTSQTVTVTGVAVGSATVSHTLAGGGYGSATAADVTVTGQPSLAAGNIAATSATLTIANHSGAWYWKYTVPGGGSCSTQEVPAGTSSKTVTGLESNTSYTFKAYGNGACSTELATAAAFPTKPPKPAKPTMAIGNTELTLSSSVSGGSVALTGWQYISKVGTGSFGTSWTPIDKTSKTLSHTFTGLTNDTDYSFKVRAVNASGWGEESEASQAMAPTDAMLTAESITATGATLTLSSLPGNITTWYYQYTSPGGGSCKSATGTTASVTGLEKDTEYTFEVYGDATCSTSLGLEVSFTTLERDPPDVTPPDGSGTPLAPSKPTATGGDRRVTLSWTSNGDGGSPITRWQYVKQVGDDAFETAWTDIPGSDADTTTYTVTDLTNGTVYRFKVRAVNAVGAGAASPESDPVTPSAVTTATVPPAPGRPTVAGGDGRVTLAWTSGGDGGSPITKWQYVRKVGGNAFETTWTDIPGSNEHTTTYTVTGLANGAAYRFRVRAVNAIGAGAASPESGVVTPAGAPPAPGRPTVAGGDGRVTLAWTSGGNGGSPITKWQYVRKVGGGAFETTWTDIPGSGERTRRYTVTGLTNGIAYRFKVRAVNAVGNGAASPESDVVTPAEAVEPERLTRVNETLAPEFVRAMVSSVVDAVRMRFGRAASGSAETEEAQGSLESAALALAAQSEALEEGTITWREALGGVSFVQSLGANGANGANGVGGAGSLGGVSGAGGMSGAGGANGLGGASGGGGGAGVVGAPTVWGVADYRNLSGGGEAGLPWDGGVGGVHLGVDARVGADLVGGLALSMSEGSVDYTDHSGGGAVRGTYEMSMTSVNPYAAWLPGDGSNLWLMLGYGTGEVEIDDEEAGVQAGDAEMMTAAVGGSVVLASRGDAADGRSSRVLAEVDAALARFDVEGNGDRLEGIEVATRRVRLALRGEGRLAAPGGAGGVLEPSVELGMRWDGGDRETGMGLELGGGLGYTAAGTGVRMELNGRTLLTRGGDVDEWGASGMLRAEPGPGGRGASFAMGLVWGEAGSGVARLWEEGSTGSGPVVGRRGPDDTDTSSAMRLEAEGGYGLTAPGGGGGLLTPYAGLGMAGDGGERSYRLGTRLTHESASEIVLEGSRRESGIGSPDHALTLEWRMRW